MQHVLWMFILVVAAAVAESWAGSAGWAVPVLALTSFYAMSVFGWRRPLLLGVFAGTITDLGFGRTIPLTPLLVLPAVAALCVIWRRSGNFHQLRLQFLPGLLCALVQGVIILVAESLLAENLFARLWIHNILLLLLLAVEGAVLLPLLCSVLDSMAHLLSLPRFVTLRSSTLGRSRFHAF